MPAPLPNLKWRYNGVPLFRRSLRIHCDYANLAGDREVVRLRDQLPVESPDAVVIAKARQLDAILLSLNGDFADIVAYPPADYQGIIAMQVRNHPEIIPQLMQRLQDYLSSHADREYYQGKLLVVEVHRIRVRQ